MSTRVQRLMRPGTVRVKCSLFSTLLRAGAHTLPCTDGPGMPPVQVAAGYVLHVGAVSEGALRVGDTVTADVDHIRRQRIVPNHTFTHVLNFALREVLLYWRLLSMPLHPASSSWLPACKHAGKHGMRSGGCQSQMLAM